LGAFGLFSSLAYSAAMQPYYYPDYSSDTPYYSSDYSSDYSSYTPYYH